MAKPYNSDPLPISMEWEQYKDGSRDQIVFDKGQNQFIDIKSVVDYIKEPQFDNMRFITLATGGYQAPSGKIIPGSFSIPVDKQKVIENKTVALKDTALIVDKIEWNLKSTDVLKAYLVMMDILANNNWERPIYFAGTTGAEGYFGLEEYFQQEGLAYRLVPIKTQPTSGNVGHINTDILYDRLINTFNDHSRTDKVNNPNAPQKEAYPYLWGGINDPRVYNCEDNIRLYSLIRSLHQRLAEKLITEGKFQKAEEVLNHGNKVLDPAVNPYLTLSQIYYSFSTVYYMNTYFKIGTKSADEKGMKMAETLLLDLKETFDWFNECDERTLEIQSENINYCTIILSELTSRLPAEKVEQLRPIISQINLSGILKPQVTSISKTINKQIPKISTLFQEIYQNLSEIQRIKDIAQLIGDTDLYNYCNSEIEKHLTTIKGIDPRMESSYREAL